MIECNITKISIPVKKFLSFIMVQRNQKLVELSGFTAVFVMQCKIREHGGFSQSR